jgi:hypothetical protein
MDRKSKFDVAKHDRRQQRLHERRPQEPRAGQKLDIDKIKVLARKT